MTDILTLILFTCLGACFSIGMQRLRAADLRQTLLMIGTLSLFVACGLWVFCLFTDSAVSLPTLLFGALYGAVYVCTVVSYYFAQQSGPLAYSAFILLASMIIPALGGYLFWDEPLGVTTLAGIALFLLSFYFICVPGGGKGSKISKKWVIFALLTFLCNGGGGIVTKAHQTVSHATQSTQLIALGYTFAFLFCAVGYGLLAVRRRGTPALRQDRELLRRSIPTLLFIAVGNGSANAGLTYLVSRMPAAYLFTTFNGGMQIIVTLYAVLALKEKIGKWGWIGLSIGMVGMIMMNI